MKYIEVKFGSLFDMIQANFELELETFPIIEMIPDIIIDENIVAFIEKIWAFTQASPRSLIAFRKTISLMLLPREKFLFSLERFCFFHHFSFLNFLNSRGSLIFFPR